jgi:hypothetical protein
VRTTTGTRAFSSSCSIVTGHASSVRRSPSASSSSSLAFRRSAGWYRRPLRHAVQRQLHAGRPGGAWIAGYCRCSELRGVGAASSESKPRSRAAGLPGSTDTEAKRNYIITTHASSLGFGLRRTPVNCSHSIQGQGHSALERDMREKRGTNPAKSISDGRDDLPETVNRLTTRKTS